MQPSTPPHWPKIGDTITIPWARELCVHFAQPHLVKRIDAHPDHYMAWVYDGCSGIPDHFAAEIIDALQVGEFDGAAMTNQCCLLHDLQYAFGDPDNDSERESADRMLRERLINIAGMDEWIAHLFYAAVRTFGRSAFGHDGPKWAFAYCPGADEILPA